MEAYQQLEEELARWSKAPYVVACASGTAALHLALESLLLPKEAKVVVPDFSMIACARAVTLAGLEPVFVDCDDNLLIDLDLLDEACHEDDSIMAVMPVHIYGRRCNMEGLNMLAGKYGLAVIEDLAEAHGVDPHPSSDAACWSFYRNKIVAGEEGGAVAFIDEDEADRARCLRCLGFTDAHDFNHYPRGHNYRLANCLASLIRRSLSSFEAASFCRRQLEACYDAACPPSLRMPPRDAPWVYDVLLPGIDAQKGAEIVKVLQGAGIAARHAFKPMSSQIEYAGCRRFFKGEGGETRAEKAAREVIYLPLETKYPQPASVPAGVAGKAFAIIQDGLG